MLSAIELYNKPDFKYREETFAILSINAWELLLKAYILKTNGYKCRFIYEYEDKRKKSGEKSQQRQIAKNRMNNPKTISIFEAIKRLFDANILPETVKSNIEGFVFASKERCIDHNGRLLRVPLRRGCQPSAEEHEDGRDRSVRYH